MDSTSDKPRHSPLKVAGWLACLCLALLLIADPAGATAIPALKTVVTIRGKVSGSQEVTILPQAGEPNCPASVPTGYKSDASLGWSVKFTGVTIPLAKVHTVLAGRRSPRTSGGATNGSFDFSGRFYELGSDAFGDPLECPLLTPYLASSTLAHDPHSRPVWTQSPGLDIFFLAADPRGFPAAISPPSFAVPYESSRERVEDALPFYAPADSYFLHTHSSKALQAGFEEVGIDWNELQGKLHSLEYKRSIRLKVSDRYSGSFTTAEDRLIENCESAAHDEPGRGTACKASTAAHYTITLTCVKRMFLRHRARGADCRGGTMTINNVAGS